MADARQKAERIASEMGVSLGPVISVSEMKKIISFFDTLTWWQWIILWGAMLAVFGATGIALGYSSGLQERQKSLAFARAVDLQLQVELGVADLDAGSGRTSSRPSARCGISIRSTRSPSPIECYTSLCAWQGFKRF
ncbi:MAG: hypothetical protein FJ010_13900, partial [Chloroflexi bacterium]|nr:hypothetical protein [Chloroflexota bacterium]